MVNRTKNTIMEGLISKKTIPHTNTKFSILFFEKNIKLPFTFSYIYLKRKKNMKYSLEVW